MNDTQDPDIDLIPLDIAYQYGVYVPDWYEMDYALPVYGYVTPFLSVVVSITNILFIVVFAKSGMKSPTHILLRFMAISDMLTVVIPTPCFMYIFLFGNYKEFMPYRLCVVWDYFTTFLPAITHTASIWLTVVLAFQRFLCVCYPLNVRIWFGTKKTYLSIFLTYVFAIGFSCSRFLEKKVISVKLVSKMNPTSIMEGCTYQYNDWMVTSGVEYLKVYNWLRAIVIQLIPCITMAIFNGIVLCKMKSAEKRRRTLRSGVMTAANGRNQQESRESTVTTWLVCFVILSVLIVEVPIAVYFLIYVCMLTFDIIIIPNELVNPLDIMLNILVLVSYPLHFVLYSCMSDKFRKTLCGLIKPKCLSPRGQFDVKLKENKATSSNGSAIVTHM